MSKLNIAIQKSGRLNQKSVDLFRDCGIRIAGGNGKLKAASEDFPAEFLFLRDDDIPHYVAQGVADIGIVGENEVWEQRKSIEIVKKLGFAGCRMSLAIPKDREYTGPAYFRNKKIATSYPNILAEYFTEKDIPVQIEKLSGSVEIATGINLADGIFDIVSTGSTLLLNGLKEVETVKRSEAVLVAGTGLSRSKRELLDQIAFRIKAVKEGSANKYILLNTPDESLDAICELLPGMKSPTVLPLARKGWSSLHSVIPETQFWKIISQLKALGAQGILVMPIEKMIV